ncbi:tetratricopeptide repeat protein [Dysgonomonas capnocytophagoides]|uniref:tetratricopeptide repeat protein n=1 Tax=Dysgonomonas capnocytophagoides TaxID=45254 RepID=UPI0030C7E94E
MKAKTKILINSMLVALFAIILVSCSSKLTPLSSSLFSVSPSPMEVQGSKIPVTINGKFPEKWFNKNAEVTVTPILKSGNSEKYGTSVTYQGENVSGNGIVISQQQGGAFTIKSEFDYEDGMVNPELYLRFTSKIKNKSVELPDVKVAGGLITTATLADAYSNTPSEAPDDFQKLIKESYDANILFLIQQAKLRSSELNSSNLAAWKDLVKSADKNSKQNVNVEVQAYASPDGGYKLNEKLAGEREKNTTSYLNNEFKKENVGTNVYANYTAQDWEGFKKLVEASSLQDKDLVLRVLSMYTDPADREREIKNVSVVYKELAETILPQLRRSRLVANVETIGKTDAELLQAVNSNPSSLNINELLYAANLQGAPAEKIYTTVTQKYPNDYRGWNNLGAYYYSNGQIDAAKQAFAKAQQLDSRAAEPSVNLGLLALADNDISKAEQLIGSASKANTASEALGLLYLKKGDYSKAVQAFGSTKSNNAALAQLLTKNYSQAEQTLNGVSNKNATTSYLKALVAARTNDATGVASALNDAFRADPSLKQRAASDIEFSKFAGNAVVSSLLK